jgi:hypothetical protein
MLSGNEVDLLEEVFSQNKDLIDVGSDNPDSDKEILEIISYSALLKDYEDLQIYRSLKVSDSLYDTYIIIVGVAYSLTKGKYSARYSETQIIGLKKLNRNYGHIFIRPETFEDKVSELFVKSEIDFPDFPKFSFRYYCLADDEIKAKSFANPDRLRCIEKQNEILIDVNGDVLIAKFSRIITNDDFNCMLEFVKNI